MRATFMALVLLSSVIAAPGAGVSNIAVAQPVIDVPDSDPDMIAAFAEAKRRLPEFWQQFDKPTPGVQSLSLKVAMATGKDRKGVSEYIWINGIERLPTGGYSGRLGNDPRDLPGRKMGDRVEFTDAEIVDWLFMRNGRMVGNETLRPLIKRMPKVQAEQIRAMMEKP